MSAFAVVTELIADTFPSSAFAAGLTTRHACRSFSVAVMASLVLAIGVVERAQGSAALLEGFKLEAHQVTLLP